MQLGNKRTQPKPILLVSGWEPEKIQFWLLFSSLSLSVPSSEQLQIATQLKILMLRLSSTAFLPISCAHFSRYFWYFEKYLKIPCNKWCFHDCKQQLTSRLKTTTCFTQTVFRTHSCHLARYTAPSVRPYAWNEFGPFYLKPWQTGGLLPST